MTPSASILALFLTLTLCRRSGRRFQSQQAPAKTQSAAAAEKKFAASGTILAFESYRGPQMRERGGAFGIANRGKAEIA
jgi:hypothetical protein